MKTKILILVLLIFSIVLTNVRCKKEKKPEVPAQESVALQEARISMEKLLATEGIGQRFDFAPGDVTSSSSGIVKQEGRPVSGNRACITAPTSNLTNYTVVYTASGGCGGGGFTYKAFFEFSITFSMAVTFTGISSNFISFYENGTYVVIPSTAYTITQTGSAGNTYYFKTSEIDLDANGVDYCNNVTGFYGEFWPTWTCSGSSYSTDVYFVTNSITNFDRCKVVSPVNINSINSIAKTATYSGWVLVCTPCNFMGTQEFEFQYRLQGSSTWTTSTHNYYLGPYTTPALASGTYEYRHRNKMNTSVTGTTAPCYGPYAAIRTFVIP